MSFLAGLRTRQPDSGHGPQLHYLLCFDESDSTLVLHLILKAPNEAFELESVHAPCRQRYSLQREHVLRPPTFLSSSDVAILKSLGELWFQSSMGCLPSDFVWSDLKGMIETRRCYIWSFLGARDAVRGVQITHVKLGPSHPIEPHWDVAGCGAQALTWRLSEGRSDLSFVAIKKQSRILFLSLQGVYVQIDKDKCLMGPGDTDVKQQNALSSMAAQVNAPVSFANLEDFYTQRASSFIRLGLPLPKKLPKERVKSTIKPLLWCHNLKDETGVADVIQLQFSICDNFYCTLPVVLDDVCGTSEGKMLTHTSSNTYSLSHDSSHMVSRDTGYWNGHVFKEFDVDIRALDPQVEWLVNLLESIEREPDGQYLWRPQGQEQWHSVFLKMQALCEEQGIYFSIDKHFSHHYVLAEKWKFCIDAQHDTSHKLSLDIYTHQLGEPQRIDLQALLIQLKAYNRKVQGESLQISLTDGSMLLLSIQSVTNLMEELADLEFSGGSVRLDQHQSYRLAKLNELLPECSVWSGDTEALSEAIALDKSPIVIDQTLTCVKATLRPYQWLGVCWLQHLKQNKCNGLLADDMGLGKTLQAITHLAFEKERDELKCPALILVPLSLTYNWAKELDTFAPQLRYKIIHGAKRHEYWGELDQYDVLITTYQLAVIDGSIWQSQALSWLILDEAQNIKNIKTKVSQAVHAISCEKKICLSGTPVENHLGELWSILSFLNPGCLGNYDAFKQYFQKPIEQEANAQRMNQLQRRIAPFMLRRTKDQIASDLPPKTITSQLISFDSQQRDFYDTIKKETWNQLQEDNVGEVSAGKKHIAALRALLTLRQACCDPALLGKTDIPSAKREHCIEMIQSLVAQGRRVLVFSQFTQMLDLLSQDLNKCKVPWLMLTGKSRNRQALVDSFQASEAPVFLISLKAGGTGLNLTRADTVIHYDPWWNSSAQKQASDRAHRIGQDKPVFVYKLIIEDSIEEKIANLQSKKELLSTHVDDQAQINAHTFAAKFEELLTFWEND